MISLDSASTEVFQILRSYDYTVMMYDDDGNQVYEPDDARRFFATPENLLVSIVDSGDNKSIRLYIGSSTDVADVLGLDQTLRSTATKYNMLFNLKRQAHDLTVQDFATRASVTESQGDNTMDLLEGMYGTTKSSYLKLENAKMIVRHSKKIDENIMGSRGRHIDAIFVENAQGERFLFPTRQMSPARAMTQHVNQGGSFADQVGQQITRMAQDYSALATGSSYIGANAMALSESATALRENIRESMRGMRKCFERMSRPSGYMAECKKLEERANMVVEGDVEGCMTSEEIKESLFVEGVELDESIVNAIAEALRNKKLGDSNVLDEEEQIDEAGENGYIVAISNGKTTNAEGRVSNSRVYLGLDDEFVEEKQDAVTYPDEASADAAARAAELTNYKVMPQHAVISDTISQTVKVLGRNVSVSAWNDFKVGKLELTGPISTGNRPQFAPGAKDAMLAFKVGEIVPLVKDDSMLNLLSYVSERINDDYASEQEKKGMRAVANHAIQIAYPKMEGFTTKASPIREFAEWLNGFSAANFLGEDKMPWEKDDCEDEDKDEDDCKDESKKLDEMDADEDHRDAPVDKESEIAYVMKHFNPADFLRHCSVDLNWHPEEEDPASLDVDDRTFDKSYVMSCLSHYLSKELEKNAGIEDEDMTQEAEAVYDKVEALMTGADYVINETDELSRDDAVIPNDQGEDFKNDVSARGYDEMDIERLRTLAGRR